MKGAFVSLAGSLPLRKKGGQGWQEASVCLDAANREAAWLPTKQVGHCPTVLSFLSLLSFWLESGLLQGPGFGWGRGSSYIAVGGSIPGTGDLSPSVALPVSPQGAPGVQVHMALRGPQGGLPSAAGKVVGL